MYEWEERISGLWSSSSPWQGGNSFIPLRTTVRTNFRNAWSDFRICVLWLSISLSANRRRKTFRAMTERTISLPRNPQAVSIFIVAGQKARCWPLYVSKNAYIVRQTIELFTNPNSSITTAAYLPHFPPWPAALSSFPFSKRPYLRSEQHLPSPLSSLQPVNTLMPFPNPPSTCAFSAPFLQYYKYPSYSISWRSLCSRWLSRRVFVFSLECRGCGLRRCERWWINRFDY
jgi:hypothetical protein